MFLKPYKLKSNAPLKGSDVKRLKQRMEKEFPNLTDEQLQLLLPAKASVSMVKIVTHSQFTAGVFCVDKLPYFFEYQIDDIVSLSPTLYAMWQVPELLPYFTTVPAVLPKLSNGADLMLPGVVTQGTGMNMYGHWKKGQLVAINLTSNTAAVAVGTLVRSSDDLYMCGGKGSAVRMLHIFGDKLWDHEPSLAQQVPNKKPAALTTNDFPALGENTHARKQKPAAEGCAETFAATAAAVQHNLENVEQQTVEQQLIAELQNLQTTTSAEDVEEAAPQLEITPEQNLKNAFLAALKNHGKSLQLPLLTSNFYRLYVVTEALQPIDLKKTKYKKLSTFLNEMMAQEFLLVREEAKGIDKIISVNLEHPEVINFITDFKKPNADDVETQEKPLFHSELTATYTVTDETAAFFTKLNYKRGESIAAAQIKKVIREYVNKQKLPLLNQLTKSYQLDETLQQICNGATEATLSEISSKIISLMDYSYQMCSVKDASTNKPMIQMSLATRSGNKKVTLVSNVECYGIIVPEFIKMCKQGAAASTTLVKLPNQKREMLQIQGNQVRFVHTLLTETYKVPAKCILGLELAKDGKKNKKK